MAKLTDRTALVTPADGDLYVTTDVSDTTDAATGTDKKITWANIKAGLKSYFDTLYPSGSGTSTGSNTGDQTSIVGITGTKAQFDTAVSDGNIMFDGDSITNVTGTAHRVFYTDGSGVITELALGADGTFLKSNGAAVAPSFAAPAGGGDVSKVGTPVDNQVGVWTGDGTIEGDTALTFDTSTNTLTTDTHVANTAFMPDANDGATLGTAGTAFADLFLAEGGVINWDSGDMTITQASNVMTIAGGNVVNNNFVSAFTTTATAAGTTTLTVDSTYVQVFTGSTTQTITLPVTSTLTTGHQFYIVNLSSGNLTLNSSGGNLVLTIPSSTSVMVTCILASGTSAASWLADSLAVTFVNGKKLGINNTLFFSGTDGTTMTFPSSSDTVVTLAATQTLTNKRRTRRVSTTNAPGATPTTNTDNVDVMNFTGLNAAITSMTTNLSGTPVDGDLLEFRFTDDGTARAITWGASFAATTVALPTTTVISTMLRVGFEYSGSTWKCIATC